MKAALIGQNSISSQWTVEAMKKYFSVVDHLHVKYLDINFSGQKAEILFQGKPLSSYDCIYIKGSFRYAQLLQALASLYAKKNVYLPVEPSAYAVAHDKVLTQLVLQQKNIPMPRTYLSATIEAARQVLERVPYPIIMKFPQGTQGKGVMFADSYPSASSILDALDALRQPFVIQNYIETNSSDIRLFVVGSRVVAAMKRRAQTTEKRANVHVGGACEAFVPDEKMKNIAIHAAAAVGASICGVDVLEGPTGPMVIEVNISPGLQGISKSTKVDVADKIAHFLFEETKAISEKAKQSQADEIMAELDTSGPVKRELITQLDFRGDRILLPAVISKVVGLSEQDQVQLNATKNKLVLERFM